jgi:mannosyltransferase
VALVILAPLLVAGVTQRHQVAWTDTQLHWYDVTVVVTFPFASKLVPPLLVVAVVAASVVLARRAVPSLSASEDATGTASYLAAHARPGLVVLYLAFQGRVVANAYPSQVSAQTDVALASSPQTSGTLYGTEVAPRTLTSGLIEPRRVWLVRDLWTHAVGPSATDAVKRDLPALGYTLNSRQDFPTMMVDLYRR